MNIENDLLELNNQIVHFHQSNNIRHHVESEEETKTKTKKKNKKKKKIIK
jgi:hypothetical protein